MHNNLKEKRQIKINGNKYLANTRKCQIRAIQSREKTVK